VKSLAKKRNTFSSPDKSDNAPTLFRMDLFGEHADLGFELRNLRIANADDTDADADGANRRQLGKMSTWVSSSSGAGKDTTELDRPALEMHCGVSQANHRNHHPSPSLWKRKPRSLSSQVSTVLAHAKQ
jgi:hypothetical protein